MTKNEWNELGRKVDAQSTKQKLYDDLIIDICKEDCIDKAVLDFGCGTGEIAQRLKPITKEIYAYDESANMRLLTKEKIGAENVFDSEKDIVDTFDTILSSLVICILKDEESKRIVRLIYDHLKKEGNAYIGFCNPKDYNVKESSLQFREMTGKEYSTHHTYKKTIKEGNFTITEHHRPLSYYEEMFINVGFSIDNATYSKSEKIDGRDCSDFVIYTLRKK